MVLTEVEKSMENKAKKKCLVKKRDFESYEIFLPFSSAIGKKKKQYLCSQLEKMHPCFSDEFAFDSLLAGVCRKGFREKVFVINKSKLAEYEGKRHFSGSGLLVEENAKHRLFINSKWKVTWWSVLVCFIVTVSGIISGLLTSRNVPSEESVQSIFEKADDAQKELPEQTFEEPFLSIFFDTVSQKNGKIENLEWRFDDFKETLNASVKGIFPEMFSSGMCSSVIYVNQLPKINISFSRSSQPLLSSGEQTKKSEVEKSFVSELRNALFESDCFLIEENILPYHVDFFYQFNESSKNLLQKLEEIINQNNGIVTQVAINHSGKNQSGKEVRIGLTVEVLPFENEVFDLGLLSENLDLFFDDEMKPKAAIRQVEKNREKIGEIKRPDNSVLVFYKRPDGRLEVE